MTNAWGPTGHQTASTTRRRFLGRAATLVTGAALTAATGALSGCSLSGDAKAAPGRREGESVSASLDRFLAETVPAGASLTALAARHGEIVYRRGVGLADREAGVKAGADTVYDVGSLTKQFTAAAVLKLETAGALSTSDPLSKFVDGLPRDKRDITLHQLLTHTAGLVDVLGDDYEVLSREALLAAAAGSELRSDPGSAYAYSNVGYSVLAAIVERVAGTGYESYLATHLFTPAGMAHTGYVLPRWDRTRMAVEYDPAGVATGRPNERPWDRDGPYWNLRGNGGILSTALDMHRWHRALEGSGVLSEAAKRKLFHPHVREGDGADTFYGYGWVVQFEGDRRIVWHNGGNGSSFADFTRLVDDGLMVFWATGAAVRDDGWNLEELELTQGMVACLRADG